MTSKNQLEALLKINGVKPDSSTEKIRSVLLSARYKDDEVDTAIMILKEDTKTNKSRVEGLHKVFRTDNTLKPAEISQLLGIDVDIEKEIVPQSKGRTMSLSQKFLVWFASTVIAIAGILIYMYLLNVGVFHPSTSINILN